MSRVMLDADSAVPSSIKTPEISMQLHVALTVTAEPQLIKKTT